MATKAAAKKAPAAEATEATNAIALVQSIASSYQDATKNFQGYGENLGQFGNVATETVQKTFGGIVAFDRAVLNCLRANLDNTVEHGRSIMQARDVMAVAQQQKAFVEQQIETVSGQIKDLTDVAEEQTKAAIAPLFAAIDEVVAKAGK